MKASTITAILAFTATALSAPTKSYTHPFITPRSIFSKRSVQDAINDCNSNSPTPELCVQVVTAIGGWDDSVNTVNNFLNIANGLTGQDLTDNEFTALNAANLEPGFLGTLMNTPGLSQAGIDAANTLLQVFPGVPQNLVLLTNSEILVSDAVDNINNLRCSFPGDANILENIGTLWVESAAAAAADPPGFPLGPNACPKSPNTGDGYSGN
jgi:hypothetical protein